MSLGIVSRSLRHHMYNMNLHHKDILIMWLNKRFWVHNLIKSVFQVYSKTHFQYIFNIHPLSQHFFVNLLTFSLLLMGATHNKTWQPTSNNICLLDKRNSHSRVINNMRMVNTKKGHDLISSCFLQKFSAMMGLLDSQVTLKKQTTDKEKKKDSKDNYLLTLHTHVHNY